MKISVQSQNVVDDFGIERGYEMIREAGFEAIDWNIDHAWNAREVMAATVFEGLSIFERPLDEILAYYAEELDAIRRNGLAIAQAHAPFATLDTPEVLDYAIRIYKNVVKFCGAVGCPRVVIHGITKRENRFDLSPADVEEMNMKLYSSLIPALLETEGVTVCLENLFTRATTLGFDFWEGCCSNPYQAVDYIDRLNAQAGKEVFGLCLDTGHLNLLRKPFHSYVPIVGKRICALHIQDNTQSNDSHLMPYAGSTKWADFLKEMKAIGYDKDLSFETFAQIRANRLPRELVPAFLRTIAEIGKYFRAQLQG